MSFAGLGTAGERVKTCSEINRTPACRLDRTELCWATRSLVLRVVQEQLDHVGAETSRCGRGKSWGSLSLPVPTKPAPLLL